jgi:hypothetical protein
MDECFPLNSSGGTVKDLTNGVERLMSYEALMNLLIEAGFDALQQGVEYGKFPDGGLPQDRLGLERWGNRVKAEAVTQLLPKIWSGQVAQQPTVEAGYVPK